MTSDQIQYNGIVLPEEWPPRNIIKNTRETLPVPYLDKPPAIIPIDIGRQLFVDDFLIEKTTLNRTFHQPEIHEASPVLTPKTKLEMNHGHCPMAAPFNDGVWYDPKDKLFKMWYQAGWFDGTALAYSHDGISWDRPEFDVIPGTNAVIPIRSGFHRDGCLIWLDKECDSSERFKMFIFFRRQDGDGAESYTSADGIHWQNRQSVSRCGDNSSFFYNPFRKKFVFSIRHGWNSKRAREYFEHPDFRQALQCGGQERVPWARTDHLDKPDPMVGQEPELYDLNAVAYESIMLGAFNIFYGPQNPICAKNGKPKIIDLQLGYSRDGFHWHRPDRRAFIPCSRIEGQWDYGYIHATGGICLVVGDELRFYYTAFSGKSPKLKRGETGNIPQENNMYAGAKTGLATLRRDGFASMNADESGGTLLTRLLLFNGKYLFVNIDNPKGELRIEILDENDQLIEPFTIPRCLPISTDKTLCQVKWNSTDDLSPLKGLPVRFRLHLSSGKLYSFWVSDTDKGKSNGYVAAGGPGFTNSTDR